MNTRKTVELVIDNTTQKIHNISERSESGDKKTTKTVEILKPECKDGICSLTSWKPVKPSTSVAA